MNHLLKLRIIQKKLIYIIGLAPEVADEKVLSSKETFGQYGNILKIMVNKNNAFNQNGIQGYSYSAYITYNTEVEAIIAIQSIDNYVYKDRSIKASYGTTKYCQYFLKNIECTNQQCLYVHEMQDKALIYNESINNKEIFKLQQKQVQQQLKLYQEQIIKFQLPKCESVFPSPIKLINKLIKQKQKQQPNCMIPNQLSNKKVKDIKIDILTETCIEPKEETDKLIQTCSESDQISESPQKHPQHLDCLNQVDIHTRTSTQSECQRERPLDMDIIKHVVNEQGEMIDDEIDKQIIISCVKSRKNTQNSRFGFANENIQNDNIFGNGQDQDCNESNSNQDYSYFQGPDFRVLLNNIYKQ